MATSMVVIKIASWGGGQTTPMSQATAQKYLGNLLGNGSPRLTNLSQAMNQAFNDQGKACGTLTYNGQAPKHASAGVIGVSSVTLFYYVVGVTLYCFAMGEHKGASSYKISDFGPSAGDFQYNKTIQL
jgi:hypothetical protein